MGLKNFFDKIEHHFTPGGKLEKRYPLFEATATVFYTPGTVTRGASHVRDAIDSETHDDPGVVGGVPGHVLGHV